MKAKPRPVGKPKSVKPLPPEPRNGEASRERLLRAAIAEFAALGFNGARVDIICRRARSNPRMIYHYFGDKAGLYVAVLERVLGELREAELKVDVDHGEPFQGMLRLFDFVYEHFGAHPELIHLLSGENLLGASFLRRSTKVPLVASPLLALIEQLLRRGARQGSLRAGLDPLHLYVVMVALCYFHRSNVHTLSAIFQVDLQGTPWQAEHRRFATDMFARFLRP